MITGMFINNKVGIFWAVDGVIVGDAVNLPDAEEYGDALQHGGHYEFWEKLKAGTDAERKFKSHAYDYFPRGRMVFFRERQIMRLYVDSCMSKETLKAVLDFFADEEGPLEIEKDEHYRCAKCNRHYLEF